MIEMYTFIVIASVISTITGFYTCYKIRDKYTFYKSQKCYDTYPVGEELA